MQEGGNMELEEYIFVILGYGVDIDYVSYLVLEKHNLKLIKTKKA